MTRIDDLTSSNERKAPPGLAERFRELRINSGYKTQKNLGEAIGLSQPAISKIESGQTYRPNDIIRCAKFLNTTPEYLLFGIKAISIKQKRPLFTSKDLSTGVKIENICNDKDVLMVDVDVSDDIPKECFVYVISSDDESMIANNYRHSFYPGDHLIFSPNKPYQSNNYILARHTETYNTIFRKVINDDGKYYLLPLNMPAFSKIPMDDKYEILGVLICKQTFFE